MFADRAQAIAEVIEPALCRGQDCSLRSLHRFHRSLSGRRPRDSARKSYFDLHRLICGDLQPDLTLLLLPSLDVGLERARRRNDRARPRRTARTKAASRQEQDAFFRRVWEKYHEIARREPQRVVLIEGNLGIDEVHEQIVEAVAEKLLFTHKTA